MQQKLKIMAVAIALAACAGGAVAQQKGTGTVTLDTGRASFTDLQALDCEYRRGRFKLHLGWNCEMLHFDHDYVDAFASANRAPPARAEYAKYEKIVGAFFTLEDFFNAGNDVFLAAVRVQLAQHVAVSEAKGIEGRWEVSVNNIDAALDQHTVLLKNIYRAAAGKVLQKAFFEVQMQNPFRNLNRSAIIASGKKLKPPKPIPVEKMGWPERTFGAVPGYPLPDISADWRLDAGADEDEQEATYALLHRAMQQLLPAIAAEINANPDLAAYYARAAKPQAFAGDWNPAARLDIEAALAGVPDGAIAAKRKAVQYLRSLADRQDEQRRNSYR